MTEYVPIGTEWNSNSPLLLESCDCVQSEVSVLQYDMRPLNGTVLRIVDDAPNGAEDGGRHGHTREQDRYG